MKSLRKASVWSVPSPDSVATFVNIRDNRWPAAAMCEWPIGVLIEAICHNDIWCLKYKYITPLLQVHMTNYKEHSCCYFPKHLWCLLFPLHAFSSSSELDKYHFHHYLHHSQVICTALHHIQKTDTGNIFLFPLFEALVATEYNAGSPSVGDELDLSGYPAHSLTRQSVHKSMFDSLIHIKLHLPLFSPFPK